jgi:hypothetical protein
MLMKGSAGQVIPRCGLATTSTRFFWPSLMIVAFLYAVPLSQHLLWYLRMGLYQQIELRQFLAKLGYIAHHLTTFTPGTSGTNQNGVKGAATVTRLLESRIVNSPTEG